MIGVDAVGGTPVDVTFSGSVGMIDVTTEGANEDCDVS